MGALAPPSLILAFFLFLVILLTGNNKTVSGNSMVASKVGRGKVKRKVNCKLI